MSPKPDRPGHDEDIWEVNTRGLHVHPDDEGNMYEFRDMGGSYFSKDDIGPERLRLNWAGRGNKWIGYPPRQAAGTPKEGDRDRWQTGSRRRPGRPARPRDPPQVPLTAGDGGLFRNPHTKGLIWYHGSRASAAQLAGGFRPTEYDAESEAGGQWAAHWNALLGVHFAAHHSAADKFARPGSGIGGASGWQGGETPSVVHARLHLRNPKVYASEHEMADDAYEYEYDQRKNYISDPRYEDRATYAANWYFGNDSDPRERIGQGEWETFDDWDDIGEWGEEQPEPVYRRTQWLNLHPDKGGIAARFKRRLIDGGHDGIVYGNEEPGERIRSSKPEANQAAVVFHPDQIEITKHHLLGQEQHTMKDSGRARQEARGPRQVEAEFQPGKSAIAAEDKSGRITRSKWNDLINRLSRGEMGRFFHGTFRGYNPGDPIEPGHDPNSEASDPEHVYYTQDAFRANDYAHMWAGDEHEPHIYAVRPTGPGETDPDPGNWRDMDKRSRHPLIIQHEVHLPAPWHLPPEADHTQLGWSRETPDDWWPPEHEQGKTAAYDAPELRRAAGSIRIMRVSQLMDLHSVNDVNAKVRDRPPIGTRLHDPRLDEAICSGTVAPVHVTDKFGAVRDYGAVITGAQAAPTDSRFLGNGHYRVHRAHELGVTHLPVTDNKLLSDFPARRNAAISHGPGPAAQLDIPEGSQVTAAGGPPRPTPPRRPGPGVTRRHRPRRGAS